MKRLFRIVPFFLKLPRNSVQFWRRFPHRLKVFFRDWVWQITTFSLLLLVYLLQIISRRIDRVRFFPSPLKALFHKLVQLLVKAVTLLQGNKERTINRINLIDLALRNMWFKKSRAIVTVGGMGVGIGAIVFLVSIGYGVNQLVIDRVARLEEMQQADVLPQPGSQMKINDESISRVNQLSDVTQVLPVIAVVAKVNYQNSSTDMAVYGVTTEYLKQTAIKPTHGDLFDSNQIAMQVDENSQLIGKVEGAQTDQESNDQPEDNFEINLEPDAQQRVKFSIYPEAWVRVRMTPDSQSPLLGYTQREVGEQIGMQVSGDTYSNSTAESETGSWATDSLWIESNFLLYEKQDCHSIDCEPYVLKRDDQGEPVRQKGYVAQLSMNVEPIEATQVLGVTSEDDSGNIWLEGEVLSASDSAFTDDGEWIEIASESAILQAPPSKQVDLKEAAIKEAVVNTAMLKVLGISTDQAVGQTFSTSFQVVGNLLNSQERLESTPTEYKIVAVVPEESAPFFYVPFIDLRSLGILNFSQLKVISSDKDALVKVRQQVESLGFATSSVADTVEQIDRLFGTIRTVLALLGMVALTVAALGMFNTLTVSLLERTREVGLMKAMGMKSQEVRELFLTESMIMGFFGGVLGISLGFLAGKLLGLFLSVFSLTQGQGFLNISYIPPMFVLGVFALSLIVGIFTGVYPALRATKISALNALRYE